MTHTNSPSSTVIDNEYAGAYANDVHDSFPFKTLGASTNNTDCCLNILSLLLVESLQNFVMSITPERLFWPKYLLV